MNQFIESFFDNNVLDFKLWSKNVKDCVIDQSKVVHMGEMLKMNRKNQKFKTRYFVLTDEHLFYMKSQNNKKIKGIMNVQWVRVQYIKENEEAEESRSCVRFIKNMKYCDFLIKGQESQRAWQKAFGKVFIQSNFHEKFSAIKMIGKGSFARVYLVEDKETFQKFAVKAFSKEYLLSQVKGKESLVNEIQIMKSMQHENIMRLEELHESKNSVYLVLELLEGGELFNHISSKANLSIK